MMQKFDYHDFFQAALNMGIKEISINKSDMDYSKLSDFLDEFNEDSGFSWEIEYKQHHTHEIIDHLGVKLTITNV